jgi:BED zinc finger
MPKPPSGAWTYFTKESSTDAKCIKCLAIIKYKTGTSGLISHLRLQHGINVLKSQAQSRGSSSCEPASKQLKMDSFLKHETLEELLAECAAKDGMPLRLIIRSRLVREAIQERGLKMPKSVTKISKMIVAFSDEKREELAAKFSSMIQAGERFSITVDEWSDTSLTRYINVTIHNKEPYRLGLVEIRGSCDAIKTEELVKKKLESFGLTFSDVIGSTHDGAAVMRKYGRLIPSESQLCHNHGIHLGITDVFYKKPKGKMITNYDYFTFVLIFFFFTTNQTLKMILVSMIVIVMTIPLITKTTATIPSITTAQTMTTIATVMARLMTRESVFSWMTLLKILSKNRHNSVQL